MISRAFKLRFRRRLRMRRLQVEELGQQTEQQLERNFFRRLERLTDVRRFVVAWVLLLILLGGSVVAQTQALKVHYLTPGPIAGGTYSEGILGAFTNANPLYATSPVDAAVSKLVFAGLLTYDAQNNLTGALAETWSANELGTVYTVRLRPDLKWHDGKPLTAADVVFTYQTIQTPDARSPFAASWQGVEVTQIDPRTITFKLPSALSSFAYSLTNGIIPKHILGKESPSALRTLPFNTTRPIGAGPFKFTTLEVSGTTAEDRQERIALEPFENYYGGEPKLARFVVYSFRTEERLLQSFREHEITAAAGLTSVPDDLKQAASSKVYSLPLTAAVMVFFKTSEGVLTDLKVRQALVKATDPSAIIESLEYPTRPVKSPLLQNQLGYNADLTQPGHDLAGANAILDAEGWARDMNGQRHKNGVLLSFSLLVQGNSEYAAVAKQLRKQWRAAGISVDLVTSDFQSSLANHNYGALLHGISLGKDPDVLVYWDSTYAVRAENRLNFSEYRSAVADEALQAGRTRLDPVLRTVKYRPFLQAWRDDAPAVGLYQPRFLYLTHGTVYGLSEHAINVEVERFTTVHDWMIREIGVPQTN